MLEGVMSDERLLSVSMALLCGPNGQPCQLCHVTHQLINCHPASLPTPVWHVSSLTCCGRYLMCVTSGSALVAHHGTDLSGAIGLILATWA
jgi:hypothetical protein